MTNQKYIALIDCDSFFVSCERKLNPELKGVPVAVVSGERGCVISRSKEAKMLGLPMGLPLFQAVQRVPECIYISANHYAYTKISKQVMNILKDFSPNVEVYSIDEAFVDFTGLTKLYKKNYFKLARELQKRQPLEILTPSETNELRPIITSEPTEALAITTVPDLMIELTPTRTLEPSLHLDSTTQP